MGDVGMAAEATLRVAVVHSFYSSALPSGENEAVLEQVRALRDAGHEVLLVARHTDDLENIRGYALRAGMRVASGRGGDPSALLAEFRPDVVHVHNLFPNIGTAWLNRWQGPVVATLHNYRPVCANGLLFRDGAVCTQCPDGQPWSSVRHACYRESRVATIPLAVRSLRGGDSVVDRADALVVLSEHSRGMWRRFGQTDDRLHLVPNFVSSVHDEAVTGPVDPRWLFAGRLTPEKGIDALLEEWPADMPLDVVGEGAILDTSGHPGVRLLGRLPRAALRASLPEYTGLVFPSLCFENAPQVVVEAFEAGLPVVTRTGGSTEPEVVASGVGAVWGAGALSLVDALAQVESLGDVPRRQARALYERRYREPAWVDAISATYREVIADRAGG